MTIKETMDVKGNANKVWSGIKGLFSAAVGLYIATAVVHDTVNQEGLIGKTWVSTVVAGMDETATCGENGMLDGTFICEKRNPGLESLVPGFLK